MNKVPHNKRITEKQEKDIAEWYLSGQTLCEIGNKLNLWPNSIRAALIRKNIPRRDASQSKIKNTKIENIFEKIDTPEKAYWLGFLYADGYNDEKRHTIVIGLSIKDRQHLEQLKAFLGSNGKTCIYKTRKDKDWLYCSISVTSSKMSKDLAINGCYQKKSLTLKFPTEKQVPKQLLWHFLRGVFDGDGCVSLDDFSLSIATSKFFAEESVNFCKINDIESYIYKPENNNCYYFRIGKRIEFAKFFKNLYKDSKNLRLERKYIRYEKTIKRLDEYITKIYDYLELRNITKSNYVE